MRLREEKIDNREVRTKLVVTEVKLAYILHSFGNSGNSGRFQMEAAPLGFRA